MRRRGIEGKQKKNIRPPLSSSKGLIPFFFVLSSLNKNIRLISAWMRKKSFFFHLNETNHVTSDREPAKSE